MRFRLFLLLLALPLASARADDHGRALFEECRACHTIKRGAPVTAGPNLAGIVGRPIGGDPGFDYSPTLRQAKAEGRIWTPELLDKFLIDPEETLPGTWMTMRGIKDAKDRAALVDFLRDPQSR